MVAKEATAHMLTGAFDDMMLNTVVKLVDATPIRTELRIMMNSHGGDTDVCYGIYDLLAPWRDAGRLTTICIGFCASAAALFLAAGSRGKRLAYPHALIGLHDGAIDTDDDPAMMVQQVECVDRFNAMGYEILAAATDRSASYWRTTLRGKSMLWLNPHEAKALGLIDHVIEC